MQVIYEPHPVAPERKAELRAAGFKIIDARFAPEAEPEAVTTTNRRRKPRAKHDADH